jgi:hypothetical protein
MRTSNVITIVAVIIVALTVTGCGSGGSNSSSGAKVGTRTVKLTGIETTYDSHPGATAYVRAAGTKSWVQAHSPGGSDFQISAGATALEAIYLTCPKQPCGGAAFLKALPSSPERTLALIPCARLKLAAGTKPLTFNVRAAAPGKANTKQKVIECDLVPVG